MKLHYSQTNRIRNCLTVKFQYLMKLHYSQTWWIVYLVGLFVSVPYEITLLSNGQSYIVSFDFVSVPYEITLLSNVCRCSCALLAVSVPYEITLLSNGFIVITFNTVSFSTL